jgi:hypothetical protein
MRARKARTAGSEYSADIALGARDLVSFDSCFERPESRFFQNPVFLVARARNFLRFLGGFLKIFWGIVKIFWQEEKRVIRAV